jgi:hypothetical protein
LSSKYLKNIIFKKKLTWSIGLFINKNENIFSEEFLLTAKKVLFQPTLFNLVNTYGHTFADPFLYVRNDFLYVLYETQNKGKVGQINAFYSSDLTTWKNITILKEPFHLSYPYIFDYERRTYLIPESFHNNEVTLYEFDHFPDKLRKVKQILKGRYSDSTFYYHNNVCYLFTTNENNELVIFYADHLLGEWFQHDKSPITKDKRISRNGGPIFIFNNKLYRISQDFSNYYGEKTQLIEITLLTKNNFLEEIVHTDLVPKTFTWNQLGTHHFSYIIFKGQNIIAVDGLSNGFTVKNLFNRLFNSHNQHVSYVSGQQGAAGQPVHNTITDYPIDKAKLTYREINITDETIKLKVKSLLKEAFQLREIADDKLFLNTNTPGSSSNSIYIGAFYKNELIGFNAFISHDFIYNQKNINCFQCCWIATDKKYRGQGIFINIINYAKKLLLTKNAGFIFSFPNELSYPIFINKLGFKEYPSLKLNIPNFPFIDSFKFLKNTYPTDINKDAFLQNNTQLLKLKIQEYGNQISVFEMSNNTIWGKVRNKRVKSLSLTYFDVGGMEINNPKELRNTFKELANRYKVKFIQIITPSTSKQNNYFKNSSPAETNNLVIFDLNVETTLSTHFNFCAGVKDVF